MFWIDLLITYLHTKTLLFWSRNFSWSETKQTDDNTSFIGGDSSNLYCVTSNKSYIKTSVINRCRDMLLTDEFRFEVEQHIPKEIIQKCKKIYFSITFRCMDIREFLELDNNCGCFEKHWSHTIEFYTKNDFAITSDWLFGSVKILIIVIVQISQIRDLPLDYAAKPLYSVVAMCMLLMTSRNVVSTRSKLSKTSRIII